MDRSTKIAIVVLVGIAVLAVVGGVSGGGGGNRDLPDVAAIRSSVLQQLAPPPLALSELRADRAACLREPDSVVIPAGQKCGLCVRRSGERLRKATFVLASDDGFQIDFDADPKAGPEVACPAEDGLKVTPSCLGSAKKCDRGEGAQLMAPGEGGRFVVSCRRLDGKTNGSCSVRLGERDDE